MSWAEEDWTVGLSGRVLQKVKELQVHHERLSRENKQKQLQLDNIQTSLEKQTLKYEEVRGELHSVQRELQSVREEVKAAVTSRDRLTQDLQTKQAQVCSFEGQLDAARTLNNKLTQEIKRLEAELEKLQNSSHPADTSLYSTPCWTTSSPWEHNGSRKEERQGQRDEGQSRAFHSRQRLQFSEVATPSLPRQQNRHTPHSHSSDQLASYSSPLAAFPWERDDTRPASKRRSPPSPQTPCTDVSSQGQAQQGVCGQKDQRTDTDKSLSEMRSRVSSLEEELSEKAGTLKSIQNELVQSQKEHAAKEISIQKVRNELSLAHTRMAQESERASGAEHRVKSLQEELKCQRQNSESSRLQHQQRLKELEKQHQRDLTELQKERQSLEKQHQKEVNKLNHELQQARTLHNALQAQADKLSLQKQELDKELGTLKEKLKWTEGQLQDSQKKEAQTQAKLMEAVREAEGVAVSLEQSRKRERALEEEGRRLAEEKADALRLLKELEEQKAAPAPPLQPVQYCPQSSYTPYPRPSTHVKRQPTAFSAEQKREEENDFERTRAEITSSYPHDREPGEGIDAEHISQVPECVERGVHRRKSNRENNSRNVVMESDSSGTDKHSTFDNVLCSSSHSAAGEPANLSMDSDRLMVSSEKTSDQASADLKRENASLRSELQDAREELQKRLDDLEAQRRAEAEARTRLKQLSRKQASQAVEKEEQEKEWRAQLESEKAETERLKKAMADLEMEVKRRGGKGDAGEREEQEEEKNRIQEDRESEMIELNIQLKKQLSEVKGQLALEREERKREEEKRNQKANTDMDAKNELSLKLEELQAELEEIKRRRKDDSPEGEKLSLANSPLTYLTLHDDELNSNTVCCDNKLLPSPEQHLLFCQSTNQHNTFVSQGTADLIKEDSSVLVTGDSPLSEKDLEDQAPSGPEDTRQKYQGGDSLSKPAPLDFGEEMERLRKETAKEAERANLYQNKLEALQNQVTCQTQQLTMAFEKQSQNISSLLGELQEKESALLSQGEELQRCKQELDELKAQREEDITTKDKNGNQKEQTQGEGFDSGLQPNLEKECALTSLAANPLTESNSNAPRDTHKQETSDVEITTPNWDELDNEAGGQTSTSGDLDKTQSTLSSASVVGDREPGQDGGAAEVLALREENQLLKQRLESLTVSDKTSPGLLLNRENQKDPVKQKQEQKSPDGLNDIPIEARQSALQIEKGSGNEERGEDGADGRRTGAEEELEEASELQIDHLQQQVVELHMKLRALSEQTKQQAEELAVWRLASQPAPTFDQLLPDTDNQSESQDLISVVAQPQSNQQQTDEMIHVREGNQVQGAEQSPGNLTIIREDEIFLSCSSNKLKGRMLFSRLQQSNLPEPKSLHPYKKSAALQENNQDTAKIDEESEKENIQIDVSHQSYACQTQLKERRDNEVLQMPSEKTGQQNVTKESLSVSGSKQTTTVKCYVESLEAKPDTCRATNEVNTNTDSSGRDLREEMISVSCQTEESLSPQSPPSASELHSVHTQTEEEEGGDEEELVESPPVSPIPLSEGAEAGEKMLFSGSFPIPADPARLAERIRRNRTQLSAAFDDTEYEPYGLPEVVMKGFADIPTGPSCPYIVRRGLLGTTVVPAPQKESGKEEEEETD